MLAIPAGNHALHRRVNVLGRRYFTGRFSGVHDWPVLGVHRGEDWPPTRRPIASWAARPAKKRMEHVIQRLTNNGDVIVQFFCAVASGQPFYIRVVTQ